MKISIRQSAPDPSRMKKAAAPQVSSRRGGDVLTSAIAQRPAPPAAELIFSIA